MKIFVDILFIDMKSEIYSIDVNDTTRLNEAKILLQKNSYIYPEEQLWFCNNAIITNNIPWNTKSRYSVIVNNKWFTFNIKTMTNNNIKITQLTSRDKVLTIKYHIYTKLKLLPDNYTLNYYSSNGTKQLEDNDCIGKYFISNNSTINLTIKLKSGFK